MNFIQNFFTMLLNIKLYHWGTKLHARHIASDELHTALSALIDTFVEVYISKNPRPKFTNGFSIQVKQLTDTTISDTLDEYIVFLKKELPKVVEKSDTHLLNIRDEMLEVLNKAHYLFSFK